MAPLTNKKVVVIGGSAGIGYAVAKAALEEGASVVICSSNQTKLDAAVRSLGGGEKISSAVVDLTNEGSIKSFFEQSGSFEHLVLTAGDNSAPPGNYPNIPLDNLGDVIQIRYTATLMCGKYAQGHVTESITTTAGNAAIKSYPGWTLVNGVASAIVGSSRGMAVEFAPLRVNCIAPGVVSTTMWATMPDKEREEFLSGTAERLPVKHVADADEIADAYIFAMKCRYLTGQAIYVDGGGSIV